MSFTSIKEETRIDVLASFRLGYLAITDITPLIEGWLLSEEYEKVQGAIEAYNEYKQELDGYGYKESKGNN